MITDLQMPLKFDDSPNDNGGKALVREIYKGRNKANVPMYIIGLTQFEHLKDTFKGVWKVWYYDSSSEDWKINLRDLIFHISLIKSRVLTEKIETIFVEGPTDKKILETCINTFFEEFSSLLYIDTIKYGGGSSWVERQLFIWAKSLSKKNDNKTYLKAIGLFDNDDAGHKSIVNIRTQIELESAESSTFSILKTSYKYSVILKSIKSKGITFPTTIENLINVKYWQVAFENEWLIKRELKNIIIDNNIIELNINDVTPENLNKIGFTDDEILLILYKLNDDYKTKFSNLACENVSDSMESVKFLTLDIIDKIKVGLLAE